MLKFIVKLHPEIVIKSKSVRKRFTKILEKNIKLLLGRVDEKVFVKNNWDNITVVSQLSDDKTRLALIDGLKRVPGVTLFLEVQEVTFETLDDIYQHTLPLVREQIENKTFCVRVKRQGKHDFTSSDVERYVGGGLNQNVDTASVKLTRPQETVKIEIKDQFAYIVRAQYRGLGGFPLPTQEDVLSLMSGGFDSGVASYQMIRKGARTHFLFFNLGGAAHEIGVKQVSHYLWKQYSSTHKVKFITVDFEPVVAEILENVENSQMGVILKRMMMRAGSAVAQKLGIQALVTGESIGQVSSQTLANLSVIDRVTETLILRPLIQNDKEEIIRIAREIGTCEMAEAMPEYCGVISKKPTVKAVLEKIEAEEANFDFDVLDTVVDNAVIKDIRDIEVEAKEEVKEAENVKELPQNAVVVDIRSPEEEDADPLEIDGIEVIHLPFFRLATKFGDLPQDKDYYLYCSKGVMSQLQALILHENGFTKVKVYRP
ncbi:tRNA uracil 4-sulfurtransferase ThiI [Pseudoalteromonas luteoviolacea]|uniref:tRNA sulfurtransferase n=1 Tax=Pseudoalteromonas luteoviolacea S4054 TaxID=1129367 RepID=A0A0F6ADP0_9GAMM|nr:tRNA uracil 4-sulfurtransferase ThiI [Pseudoalteromonas luteoviolacea]AOT09660.1 tRNA 4-thiouridine(8) synthase ThiI [Pseudoalteromonas luteoviolacea]AOT14573.1 tRNA 4-thiouridine(8) synthase ThiI [Pseudoalteromonas luteoviolacea]AOT19487.1 tRNA 4-thiouridine(8) synthase ThiI [Pseudoalteromonas luteoviolacea]KKE83926.1 tRNA s(4)U8 sulfurtransferase [Pseudoalteromonas luteoviolacea S4054]KZN77320.1 tRNA s(4)U8 sulfurtransferase [Pseudoalteromonas luteoviolacea S4047-1]